MRGFLKNCQIHGQFKVIAYFLFTSILSLDAYSFIGRKPANFVPDDDMIVVPLIIEKNIIDKFHDKHENKFNQAKRKLEFWISQEEYAQNYGLEDTGIVRLPTPEEKQRFLERNYLRFLSKDVERSSNQALQSTVERWTANDELDSIEMIEMHEKTIVKAQRSRGKSIIKHSKTVKVGKNKVKFDIQPRLELGMVKMTLKSKYLNARAWIGVNGNQELRLSRKFKSTKTKASLNYFIDQSRTIAAIDQNLSRHWRLRLTHSKTADGFSSITEANASEDNVIQLRFGMGF